MSGGVTDKTTHPSLSSPGAMPPTSSSSSLSVVVSIVDQQIVVDVVAAG